VPRDSSGIGVSGNFAVAASSASNLPLPPSATSSLTRGDQHPRGAVVDDVGELVRGQVGIDAGVVQPRALAGPAALEVAAVVLHEYRVVVQALQAVGAQQVREAVGARLVLGVGHRLAAARHDESRL